MTILSGVTARDIAVDALMETGALPRGQTAPHEPDVIRTLRFLDRIIRELAATRELPWLQRVWSIPVSANTETYDLADATQTSDGCDPSIIGDWQRVTLITTASGERCPLALLREPDWTARRDTTQVNVPDRVWIERRLSPLMHLYPLTDQGDTYSVELVGRIQPERIAADQGTALPVPDGWARYLKLKTAYDISGGAILRMPLPRREEIKRDAAESLTLLLPTSGEEHQGPRLVGAWGVDANPSRAFPGRPFRASR